MGDVELLGRKLIDFPDLGDLILLFAVDFIFLVLIIRFIYLKMSSNKDYIFTFFVFNIVIFFLCVMLSSVKLKVGVAFGLFAILSILRYRTETIPIKEMTYLFVSIALAVINSMVGKTVSLVEILFTNSIIVFGTYMVQRTWLKDTRHTQKIKYENMELIHNERRGELIRDLESRLGKSIESIDIQTIDFVTNTVNILVYFEQGEN